MSTLLPSNGLLGNRKFSGDSERPALPFRHSTDQKRGNGLEWSNRSSMESSSRPNEEVKPWGEGKRTNKYGHDTCQARIESNGGRRRVQRKGEGSRNATAEADVSQRDRGGV